MAKTKTADELRQEMCLASSQLAELDRKKSGPAMAALRKVQQRREDLLEKHKASMVKLAVEERRLLELLRQAHLRRVPLEIRVRDARCALVSVQA